MSITSITKGTLSGLLFGFSLIVCVGVASAAGGDGTGGGTGSGTGGGNRDGTGGGKKVGRQIEVGQTKKKVDETKRKIVVEEAGPKVELKVETEAEPAQVIEALPVATTETIEPAPEAEAAPVADETVTVTKNVKAKAKKKKVIVIEQAPIEANGNEYNATDYQYEDGGISYMPSSSYEGGSYGGDSCE